MSDLEDYFEDDFVDVDADADDDDEDAAADNKALPDALRDGADLRLGPAAPPPEESSDDEEEAVAPESEAESDSEAAAAPPRAWRPPPGSGPEAAPERQAVDPMLRASNKSRAVIVVPPEKRRTDDRLHRTELAQVLAVRAEQIADFPTVFTDGAGLTDPVDLAIKELYDHKCPLILRREIGRGPRGERIVEDLKVAEMIYPALEQRAPLGRGEGRT